MYKSSALEKILPLMCYLVYRLYSGCKRMFVEVPSFFCVKILLIIGLTEDWLFVLWRWIYLHVNQWNASPTDATNQAILRSSQKQNKKLEFAFFKLGMIGQEKKRSNNFLKRKDRMRTTHYAQLKDFQRFARKVQMCEGQAFVEFCFVEEIDGCGE